MNRKNAQVALGIIIVLVLISACSESRKLPDSPDSYLTTNALTDKLTGSAVDHIANTNSSILILPQELIGLSSNDIVEMERLAQQTNGLTTAIKLANYYSLVKDDVEKQIKYLKIAAAQGDIPSQYNLGFVYSNIPQVKDLKLAKYWFSVAAKSGDIDAQLKLRTLEDRQ